MTSFGHKALQTVRAGALLELERNENCGDRFSELESLVGELLVRGLNGERIVTMTEDELHVSSVVINGLSRDQREFLTGTFSINRQQARGAWFLPEKVSLEGGSVNFAWYFAEVPRFVQNAADTERGRVFLKSSPDAVFLWAVLGPLFDGITYPMYFRGELAGTMPAEEHLQAWQTVDDFYADLGFQSLPDLAVFRQGGGWHKLRSAPEQVEAKRALLKALAHEASPSMGARYRARTLLTLVEQYYKKAKADGRVKRKQVITKGYQPLLSGLLGGDWLALLDYLGEEPHPDEQIVTAMPKTPLRVGGTSKAAEIAAQAGLPAEEVERIAASLWGGSGGRSPVEERVGALKRHWQVFDDVHAKQSPGMRPLWGLVEEARAVEFERNPDSPYQSKLYLELLPRDLQKEIERLWGTVMLPKWPDRVVTEPFPYQLAAETFGPALLFWQSCALTAWFICEGPYSRTDMAGLAHHQRRELAALKDLNTPIDGRLFEELIQAEARLGPAEPIERGDDVTDAHTGFTITVSMVVGTRRKGFENLRDIVTKHRRAWSTQYLDKYLRERWEAEIGEAASAFNLQLSEKGGKAPTLKQFARAAALPTNHWFGGDVSALYPAIGEKSPAQPERRVIMPEDKAGFVRAVFKALPLVSFVHYDGKIADRAVQESFARDIAELGIKFVQLEEAMGRPPEMKEIGERFAYRHKVLSPDPAEAWHIFKEAVENAKRTRSLKTKEVEEPEATAAPQSPSRDSLKKRAKPPEPAQIPQALQAARPAGKPKEPLAEVPVARGKQDGGPTHPERKRSWLSRLLGRR